MSPGIQLWDQFNICKIIFVRRVAARCIIITMLNYKENKDAREKRLHSYILMVENSRFLCVLKLLNSDSDLDRKFNIDYVTESVGKADNDLGTNLRVKGPWSGNLCPQHGDTLRPQQPHTWDHVLRANNERRAPGLVMSWVGLCCPWLTWTCQAFRRVVLGGGGQ